MGLHAREGEGSVIVPATDDTDFLPFQFADKGADQLKGAARESQFGFLRTTAPQTVPLALFGPESGFVVPGSAIGFVHLLGSVWR